MHLPPEFTRRIISTFDPEGEPWLARLPALVKTLAHRWGLQVGPPFPGLSYNYVAPAARADGSPAVLKLGVPCPELTSEIVTLGHYGGRGACRLIDSDPEAGALLIERLLPGDTLAPLAAADDAAATTVAAAVLAALWSPPPPGLPLRDLPSWTGAIEELRPHFGGGTGPFPAHLVDRALGLRAELLASQGPPVVLHGDLHHFNILRAGDGWRAIDPKGLIGEAAYDCAAFLYNPWDTLPRDPGLPATLARRIAILADTLGLDPYRVHGWALAQAVLSAWWSYEDGGELAEVGRTLVVAEALATLRP